MLETSNTGQQQATVGNSAKHRVHLETLATLSYNRQLLATQQHIGWGAGDSRNTGLQQATAGNSTKTQGVDAGD